MAAVHAARSRPLAHAGARETLREARSETPHKAPGPQFTDVEEDTRAVRPWLVTGVAFLLLGSLLRNHLLIAAASMLLLAIGCAWVWFKLSLRGVVYAREFRDADGFHGDHNEVRAFLGETVSLTLRVHNRKLLPLNWLRVTDVFPIEQPVHGADVTLNRATHQGELLSFWMPGAHQTLERHYTIACTKRGYSTYGPATITTGDGFGFFTATARIATEHRLIVYPRLYTAADTGLPAKNPFGERASAQQLFEDPLRNAGIREWHPADGLRRVHWKASAKHQSLLSRVYEPSEEPQVEVILNVATLERYWEGVVEAKHELAVSVAGTLAQIASEARIPVGVMANGYLPGSDQNIRLLPGRSRDQLMNILELLAAATPYASHAIEDFLLRRAPALPWGATLAVVTAVTYDALYDALAHLARSGRKLLLFSVADVVPEVHIQGVKVYHLAHLAETTLVAQEIRA